MTIFPKTRVSKTIQYLIAELMHDSESESERKIRKLTENDPRVARRVLARVQMPGYWYREQVAEQDWRHDYRLDRASRILNAIIGGRPVIPADLTSNAEQDEFSDQLLDELLYLIKQRNHESKIINILKDHYPETAVRTLAARKADFDENSDVGIVAFRVLDLIRQDGQDPS